jgi:hypothetical protein
MTHYLTIPDSLYALLLRRNTYIEVEKNKEKYKIGDRVIISEYVIKGDYVSGNQFITEVKEINRLQMKDGKLTYLVTFIGVTHSHS